MKLLALLPLCVELVLALSSEQIYKHHLDLAKRGYRRGVGQTYGSHGPLNRMKKDDQSPSPRSLNRRAARCSAKTTSTSVVPTSTTSVIQQTTKEAPPPSSSPAHTTSTSKAAPPPPPPKTTSTQAPAIPHTTSTNAAPHTTAAGSGGSGTTSSSDIQAYLSGHNTVRAAHGASAVTWSDTLASAAQTWANKCVFEHSGGSLGPYGENLAAGSGAYSIASGIQSWANEEPQYSASNPQASHYTQMVWKATTQIGCAVASCDLSVFTPNFWPAQFYVCEYFPQGNVIGAFAQNVQ